MKAAQSLIDSPLTTVANVAKREPAAVLSALIPGLGLILAPGFIAGGTILARRRLAL